MSWRPCTRILSRCESFLSVHCVPRAQGDTSYNNPDKGAVAHAIVHRALWEYLAAVADLGDEAEAEKLRRDLFET